MNKHFGVLMILVLACVDNSLAQDSPATATPVVSVPKPLVLILKDKIPDTTPYKLPKPPGKYVDNTALVLMNDVDNSPQGPALLNLTDIDTLEQIPAVNQADKISNKYYWHAFKGWNYCHYRDGDREWYGWRTGDTFHWVFWRLGRFWWHDSYAERWLYYDRGYWWWQSLGKNNQIQVFLNDGHFHACDADGVLGDDLMATGTVEYVTGPGSPKSTPGTGKHGGHHHGGGSSTGGGTGNSYPGGESNGN